jgi:putative ABC transport system permease protein
MTSVVLSVSTQMLLHNRPRFIMTIVGIALAFFLAAAQIGLLVGWTNTNSAIITHAGVDLWIMAKQTRSFDFGTAIPRHRIQQVRSVSGIIQAEGMLVGWDNWQHPEGKRITVEIVGLDTGNLGGPWLMTQGSVDSIHLPEHVIIDELSTNVLGVYNVGEETELEGKRVIVGGISQGIRTFTSAPFVFTSIENALDYVPYYRDDEISYVLAKVSPESNIQDVQDTLTQSITNVEVLTTAEFADRSVRYWMLETGAGITVIITAILGLLVGAVIMSQTLFAITQDHLANYATLLALGFHQNTLRKIVLTQSFCIGGLGIVFGALLFVLASNATARSPIPLETTPYTSIVLICFSLACCLFASWFSIRAIFKLDPVMVFQG